MSAHIPDDIDDDEFLYGSSEPTTDAPAQSSSGQDSEAFDLYGVGGEGGSKSTEVKVTAETTGATQSSADKKIDGDGSKSDQDGEEDDERSDDESEEEDSESDIEIVLDDEETRQESSAASKQTVVNIKASAPTKPGSTTVTNANGTVDVIPATKPGGLDINAVGSIDGVELFDVDLDGAEDKPWRKPGADLTDYFNYGFNENIWRAYCQKQKMMRDNPFAGGKGFDIDPSMLMDLPDLGMGMPPMPGMPPGMMPMGMPGMPGMPRMPGMPGMPGMPNMMGGRGMPPMPGMGMNGMPPMGNMMNPMNQRGGPGGAGRGGRFMGPGGPGGPPGGPGAGRGRGNDGGSSSGGTGGENDGGKSPSYQRKGSIGGPGGGDESGDGPNSGSFQNQFQQGGAPFFGADGPGGFNQGNFRGNGRGAGGPAGMRGGMMGGGPGAGRGRGGPGMAATMLADQVDQVSKADVHH
ncbi:hypothetical protein KVV02_001031 [Mortierella alpina]|uniref:Pre-mRNA polyadenylation factor Fip1 domain-containing protein n=1 Tax=Mortierella alpina TaxID=64518 RepID=A0A9P8AA05_MORAP|nr:hypothetical protein KVV02_001031 [Mortierella alpina]